MDHCVNFVLWTQAGVNSYVAKYLSDKRNFAACLTCSYLEFKVTIQEDSLNGDPFISQSTRQCLHCLTSGTETDEKGYGYSMAAFSRWVAKAKLPIGNALVPGTLGRVLVGTRDAEAVLTFKIIVGLCPGSGTVLFTLGMSVIPKFIPS